MAQNFILLTNRDRGKTQIIISISNIGTIRSELDETGTIIMLNFSRGKDAFPRVEHVIETFDEVKAMIGL